MQSKRKKVAFASFQEEVQNLRREPLLWLSILLFEKSLKGRGSRNGFSAEVREPHYLWFGLPGLLPNGVREGVLRLFLVNIDDGSSGDVSYSWPMGSPNALSTTSLLLLRLFRGPTRKPQRESGTGSGIFQKKREDPPLRKS